MNTKTLSKFSNTAVFISAVVWIIVFFRSPLYPDISEIEQYSLFPLNFISSILTAKIFKSLIFLICVYLVHSWSGKILGKTIANLSTIIFIFLPWNLYLFAYSPLSVVILSLLLFTFYFQYVKHPGKLISRLFLATLLVLLIINFDFIKRYYLNDFELMNQINPVAVESRISETVKTQFLSVNQEFLIPKIPRKLMFNYPLEASLEIIERAVSYFDIEQWTIPADSYAITSRSGMLPKGQWPLLYLWQIPVLVIGLYFIQKKNINITYLGPIFLISFILFMFSGKRGIQLHQILLIPFIAVVSAAGVVRIMELPKGRSRQLFAVCFFVIGLFMTVSTFNAFIRKQNAIRYTHAYIYYLNAKLYEKYVSDFGSFVISSRYGPSDVAMNFYLKNRPDSNIEFKQFNQADMEQGKLYIGLSGEFEKYVKDAPEIDLEILEHYRLWDPPVTQYGDELWVAYRKITH